MLARTAIKKFNNRGKKLEKDVLVLWSKAIKLRAGGICEFCHMRGAENSHHILGKGAHHRMKTCLENGIALCFSDHRIAHSQPRRFDTRFEEMFPGRYDRLVILNKTAKKIDWAAEKIFLEQYISGFGGSR